MQKSHQYSDLSKFYLVLGNTVIEEEEKKKKKKKLVSVVYLLLSCAEGMRKLCL